MMIFKLFQVIGKDGIFPETFSVLSNSSCQKLNKIPHKHKEHKSVTLMHEVTKPFYKPLANQIEQYIICIA